MFKKETHVERIQRAALKVANCEREIEHISKLHQEAIKESNRLFDLRCKQDKIADDFRSRLYLAEKDLDVAIRELRKVASE